MKRRLQLLFITAVVAVIGAAPAGAVRLDLGLGTMLGRTGISTGASYRIGRWDDRLGTYIYLDASRYVNRPKRRDRDGDERRREERDTVVDRKASRNNVRLDVTPRNSWVYLNGVRIRADGREALSLPEGRHRLEFLRPGYRLEVSELNVQAGVKYRVERSLERLASGERADPRVEQPGEPVDPAEALRAVPSAEAPTSTPPRAAEPQR